MQPEPNTIPARREEILGPVDTSKDALDHLHRLGVNTDHFRTNLPLKETWAKSWYVRLGGLPDYRLEALEDEIFRLAYFHMKVVPVLMRTTGEIVPRVMVTLFDPDGKTLAWTSEITTSKFGDILNAHGKGPWDPPLELTVRAVPGKERGQWYWFEPKQLPRPEKTKGGTKNGQS